MSLHRPTTDILTGEGGAIAVLVAIILPAMILFGSFVIDVGNAFLHHRHLQLQADAAALAGGEEFAATTCNDANILGRALQYSSVPQANTNWSTKTVTSFTPSYNAQLGGTPPSRMYEAINAKNYLPAGNTAATDPTTYTGSPCGDSMLDVKITETNLPWYLQAGGLNYMNAHARVSWAANGGGELPLAVDENSPLAAEAYFVDESNGNVLASAPLVNSQTPVGGTGTYSGDQIWTSSAAPASLAVTAHNIGVIIALSGDPSTTTCGQPSVTCFTQNTGTAGDDLVRIQGYSAGGGTQAAPVAGPVTLSGSSCSSAAGLDGYYSASTATSGTCSVGITATVNVGGANPSGMKVEASIGNTPTLLTFANGVWSGTLSIANGSGANDIDLWVCGYNSIRCNKNGAIILSNVHATFAANDNPPNTSATNSGTIDGVVVSQVQAGGVLAPGANSFPICGTGNTTQAQCTPQLVVTADIGGSIQDAASVNDPLFALNFGPNNTSSQTGTIECPPGTNSGNILGTTLLTGCPGQYQLNYAQATNTFTDPSCNNTNPTPGPADCVQAKNGGANGVIGPNLYSRFVTPQAPYKWYCANNWSNFNIANPPYYGLPPNDSRIISLFIIPYNSFSASGSQGRIVPILDFAQFYVMGWQVSGQNSDPCPSDPPDPQAGKGNQSDRIWGHFIRYTNPYAPPSNLPCKNSALGACVIALTQ